VNQPLPGWVHGNAGVVGISGLYQPIDETFVLYLRDYSRIQLNACANSTPVDWVAVRIRFALIGH
jgi:hypothetical protein